MANPSVCPKLSLCELNAEGVVCDLLAIPLRPSELTCESDRSDALRLADASLASTLLSSASQEGFLAKPCAFFPMHLPPTASSVGSIQTRQVFLMGQGVSSEDMRMSCGKLAKLASEKRATTIAVAVPPLLQARQLKAMAEGILLGHYRFNAYKTGKAHEAPTLSHVMFLLPGGMDRREAQAILEEAVALADGVNFARRLVDTPACDMTPTTLAEEATQMAQSCGLTCDVLSGAELERQNVGLFLAVARGSSQTPKLIHLTWMPEAEEDRKKAPVVLVGKAITYDAGGLCLKTAAGMLWMKTDMAGAASVLGAMKLVARMKPNFPVHALMGACENMVDGASYRPGDVLISHTGKTVEVCDTDAEGRLTLADMVALGADLKPTAIIDVATLTGAVAVALGLNYTGLFSDDDDLCREITQASERSGEQMWRLPLDEKLKGDLDSTVADIKNLGERYGGAITAALFVKEFAGGFPWAHLDIAGTCRSKSAKGYVDAGATGVAVRTLAEFIRARSASSSSNQA